MPPDFNRNLVSGPYLTAHAPAFINLALVFALGCPASPHEVEPLPSGIRAHQRRAPNPVRLAGLHQPGIHEGLSLLGNHHMVAVFGSRDTQPGIVPER